MANSTSRRHLMDKWWVYGLLILVLWTGVRVALNHGRLPVSTLVGAVAYAALMTGWLVRRRQRDARAAGIADAEDVPGLERRILKGDPPSDPAEREQMRALVARRRRGMRRTRVWALPLLGLIFVGSGVTFLVGHRTIVGVGVLIASVVFFGWVVWVSRRNRVRLSTAEGRLADESPGAHRHENA
ncbi:hypothetical protein [Streptomyces sp. SID3343]|uniref:hypothetical protein n=1 Tax=Streptomyces sp. SID3343 TaxID=2690260 RepID=UPI00136BB5DA|nr:hypothetical protein [Streptomyces sp. SID3343]MYW06172.1 hypothetical protein [Streptomyces sp. SID3343]